MSHKIQLLLAGLILLANILIPQAKSEQINNFEKISNINLTPTWTKGITSEGIGSGNILVSDFNKDGKNEIATCWKGYLIVYQNIRVKSYEVAWLSENLKCRKIATADRDSNGVSEFYILTEDLRLVVLDGRSHKLLNRFEFSTDNYASDLAIADVDSDGKQEIVIVNGTSTYIYDAISFKLEWKASGFGGNSVKIANLDRDPDLEIAVNGNTTHILNAVQKTQEWEWLNNQGITSSFALGDVDGDNMAELAYMADWHKAYVVDGDTRKIKWEWTQTESMSSITVADIHHDGFSQVIIGYYDRNDVKGYQGKNGAELWNIPNPEDWAYRIGAGDTDNDGTDEIFWAPYNTTFIILGSWQSETVEWISEPFYGPLYVSAGDIDTDGQDEIVMSFYGRRGNNYGGTLNVYDALTHRLEWSTSNRWENQNYSKLAVGQLDSDAALEILVLCGRDVLQVYDGVTQQIEWTSPNLGGNPIDAVLQDLDGDHVDEIILAVEDTYAYDYSYVKVLKGTSSIITWKSARLAGKIRDIALGNLDGDSVLDLAILTDKRVYVYRADPWKQDLSRAFSYTYGMQLAIISEADNTGGEFVIASNPSSYDTYELQAWSGATFNASWSRTLDGITVNDLAASDVDSDGVQELLVMGSRLEILTDIDRSFLGIASKNHPTFWKYQMKSDWGPIFSAAVTDIDRDEKNELILSSADMMQVNEINSTPINFTFLPMADRPQPGIYGKVTMNGAPAAHIYLSLRFYDGSTWSTASDTFTSEDGSYIFNDPPSLGPGQYYYVLYENNTMGGMYPDRLLTWHTRSVNTFKSGDGVPIGDFDLANIEAISPSMAQKVRLPFTFQWTLRPATPSDSYALKLYNPYNPDVFFYTNPPLGYADRFTLNTLPSGFKTNAYYWWEIWVYSPDGGFGISYEIRTVSFSNTNQSSSLTSPLDAQSLPPRDPNWLDRDPRPLP